jgi:hypothetical protein
MQSVDIHHGAQIHQGFYAYDVSVWQETHAHTQHIDTY